MGHKKRKRLLYKRKNGKNKKSKNRNHHNSGQILEDLIDSRLQKYKSFHSKHGVFYAIGENVKYIMNDRTYEIDNNIVRLFHDKVTVAVIEAKMGEHQQKAYIQLGRHVEYIKNNYNVDRILCFYAHGYNKKTKKYKMNRVKDLEWRLK